MTDRNAVARQTTFEARDTASARTIAKLLQDVDAQGRSWFSELKAEQRAALASAIYGAAHTSMELTVESLRKQGEHAQKLILAGPPVAVDSEPIPAHVVVDEEDLKGPFTHLLDPRDPATELALAYYRAKPEMAAVFPTVDTPEFARWIQVDAYGAYPAMRELLPPVPPPALQNVVSTGGLNGFLDAGLAASTMVRDVVAKHLGVLRAGASVLDFGCGCGRVLRFLIQPMGEQRLHGCDIDEGAVGWCQDHLSEIAASGSSAAPPLSYGSGSFDLIYSISVFSHLEESNHRDWIEELARVSRPNGIVILTTHGPRAMDAIRGDEGACANVGLTVSDAAEGEAALARTGYAFIRQAGLAHDADLYGMTFIEPGYIEEHWSEHFDVLEHVPRGLQSWQDVVVLRRK